MKQSLSYKASYNYKPRKYPKRSHPQIMVNYQVKGFISDNEKNLSPEGVNQASSYSNLVSSSDEERKNLKEVLPTKIMFEGVLIKNSLDLEEASFKLKKFQDSSEKMGPNPKHISLPWFV